MGFKTLNTPLFIAQPATPQNLKCGGCANTITKKLNALDDVSEVSVEVEDNSVTFEYSEDHTLDVVKKALAEIGYPEDGEANNLTSKAKS